MNIEDTMRYNTGLLVGRAFALANTSPGRRPPDPAAELSELAQGDRLAIMLAQDRYREFIAHGSSNAEEHEALALLEAALDTHTRAYGSW